MNCIAACHIPAQTNNSTPKHWTPRHSKQKNTFQRKRKGFENIRGAATTGTDKLTRHIVGEGVSRGHQKDIRKHNKELTNSERAEQNQNEERHLQHNFDPPQSTSQEGRISKENDSLRTPIMEPQAQQFTATSTTHTNHAMTATATGIATAKPNTHKKRTKQKLKV